MTNGSRARAFAGSNYPFLTQKERDIETGLDYFGARYFVSMQGRFTGADPYDINLVRQDGDDPEEADALFRNYIEQPQHWNRYSHALNNPLRYVDPDGMKEKEFEEYKVEILGQQVTVKISNKITDDAVRADIKNKIQDTADLINERAKTATTKLTADEVKTIHAVTNIKIYAQGDAGMNGNTFEMDAHRVLYSSVESLAGDTIHDSYHTKQWNYSCGSESGREFERRASAFTVRVIKKLGLSGTQIEHFESDALLGHMCNKNPKKKL